MGSQGAGMEGGGGYKIYVRISLIYDYGGNMAVFFFSYGPISRQRGACVLPCQRLFWYLSEK